MYSRYNVVTISIDSDLFSDVHIGPLFRYENVSLYDLDKEDMERYNHIKKKSSVRKQINDTIKEIYRYFHDSNPFRTLDSKAVYNSIIYSSGDDLISFFVLPYKPRTFKFVGMDITENLDVVIKFGNCAVLVDNLILGLNSYINEGIISSDNIRYFIENLKFGGFEELDINSLYSPLLYGEGLKNIKSIILNIIIGTNEDYEDRESKDIMIKFNEYFRNLVKKYHAMYGLLKALSLYFKMIETLQGKDKEVYERIIVSGNEDLLGRFEGICEDGSDMWKGIDQKMVALSLFSEKGINYIGKEDVLAIMSEPSFDIDYTEVTVGEALSRSILDYMKYKDEDLVIDTFDFEKEDRGILMKNIVKLIKKKFRDYGINNEVIDNVSDMILKDEKGVILKNTINNSENSKKFMIDLTGFIKSSKLLDKVFKRVVKAF